MSKIISLGILKVDENAKYEQCHEQGLCDTPCSGSMISVPAIPDYYSRTRRHLICQAHMFCYWGAINWYKKENNLEEYSTDRKNGYELAFTEKKA